MWYLVAIAVVLIVVEMLFAMKGNLLRATLIREQNKNILSGDKVENNYLVLFYGKDLHPYEAIYDPDGKVWHVFALVCDADSNNVYRG